MGVYAVTTTFYLYGIEPERLMQLNYFEAITLKHELAKDLIAELYEEPMDSRDEDRIAKVHKAIKHNQDVLKELK